MPATSYASSVRSLSPDGSSCHQRRRQANAARTVAFVSAILSALCAGSVTVFSLYGHIFQERLLYSQFQVNGIAIAASIAAYLPVPLMGFVCDRAGPAPLSLFAGVVFGLGYGLAAVVYRSASAAGDGRPTYGLMVTAFVGIGVATCAMYLSAVATCAKNFGRGRHRGLALAMPIAAYGLSGMWQSQLGSRVLYERSSSSRAGSRGDVDVFAFFVFLAVLLVIVGVIGSLALRIVDEDALIDGAVEELERSGLLDGSTLFMPSASTAAETEPAALHGHGNGSSSSYGTMARRGEENGCDDEDENNDNNNEDKDDNAFSKKDWVLNAETRRFLSDHTMWLFALGFFFMIGPGEAFINNLGTVIKSLQDTADIDVGRSQQPTTTAATHVSIVGITSTVVRLLTGSLTDLLAPQPQTQHLQPGGAYGGRVRRLLDSDSEEEGDGGNEESHGDAAFFSRGRLPSVSRVAFLLAFALVLSAGLVLLASGLMQGHGERFWLVSGLVGAGYGAVFSLTPIIITVIWGVENFATNWGIVAMFPALGATLWGLVYSAVYQAGVGLHDTVGQDENTPTSSNLCYGKQCYASTFKAMSVSVWVACVLVLLAWKGHRGWAQRNIVI